MSKIHPSFSPLALVCLCAFAPPASALTEAQFIEKVLAQDKLLEEAQIGVDIKRIELDASRDNYQNWKPSLFVEADYRHSDLDRDTTSTRTYDKQRESTPAEVGVVVEKRFLSNPGSLKFSVSRSKDKKSITTYKRNPNFVRGGYNTKEYQTETYIRYNHPLLKHDSNAESLKTYRRDIVDLQRQQLLFFETKEDFLDDRLHDYLSWVLYQRQDEMDGAFIKTLRALRPRNDADAALLQSTLSQVETDNADTQNRLRAMREKLAVLLDDDAILNETPEFDLNQRAHAVDGDLTDYLKNHNRELQRIALAIALKEIDIDYYQNQNLPTLDFAVEARRTSASGNSSATTYYDDDKTYYAAGFEFNLPLGGNITNRANLAKSKLGMRKLAIGYQEKLQDLLADIRLLDTLLMRDQSRLLAAIDALAQTARIAHRNYAAGETSLRDLLEAYRDERGARLDHLEHRVAYQQRRIQYDNLLDRIIRH